MTQQRYQVEIVRRPMASIFEVRGEPGSMGRALGAAGLLLPEKRNRITPGHGGTELLRLGPRRVLVLAAIDREELLAQALERAFAGVEDADVAVVSDMFVRIDVTGAGAEDVLRQGTPLDLASEVFPPDAAAGTEMWSIGVVLMRPADVPAGFAILVERPLVGFLESWLSVAAGSRSDLMPATMLAPPKPAQSA